MRVRERGKNSRIEMNEVYCRRVGKKKNVHLNLQFLPAKGMRKRRCGKIRGRQKKKQ